MDTIKREPVEIDDQPEFVWSPSYPIVQISLYKSSNRILFVTMSVDVNVFSIQFEFYLDTVIFDRTYDNRYLYKKENNNQPKAISNVSWEY